MAYKIILEPGAFSDIQESIDYYNKKQIGLGKRFHQIVKSSFDAIKISPYYQIRYSNVRCFYTKPFPFLIHFSLNEQAKIIHILAVLHTSKDPKNWPKF
ncbi:MAG: type II toxin-antitoxin system RelE/ParE family toxin [Bacteroidia bacterium]|nr:type II toxin-antitoxin system RelE/ParE family toxin [Bacteroidia bacterium]MCF8446329.1 type II toxin-antitoxin system RelE/ParE family toxin [Bacteroidia bacterium]